jgi:hypothetical protein
MFRRGSSDIMVVVSVSSVVYRFAGIASVGLTLCCMALTINVIPHHHVFTAAAAAAAAAAAVAAAAVCCAASDNAGKAFWQSHTRGNGNRLQVRDGGFLQITASNGRVIWQVPQA